MVQRLHRVNLSRWQPLTAKVSLAVHVPVKSGCVWAATAACNVPHSVAVVWQTQGLSWFASKDDPFSCAVPVHTAAASWG